MLFKGLKENGKAPFSPETLCFHPSCIWALVLPPAHPLPQSSEPLHPLWCCGPLISQITVSKRKRTIAGPVAALERALSLLQILHWCSSLKSSVRQVQNYCRCGANSARIGQPVALKSTAFKRVHLRMCGELAGSRAARE